MLTETKAAKAAQKRAAKLDDGSEVGEERTKTRAQDATEKLAALLMEHHEDHFGTGSEAEGSPSVCKQIQPAWSGRQNGY